MISNIPRISAEFALSGNYSTNLEALAGGALPLNAEDGGSGTGATNATRFAGVRPVGSPLGQRPQSRWVAALAGARVAGGVA